MSSIPNDEQINKIIVRTPEELGLFEEMDAERDARYQQEWENAGNAGDYPRLVTYDELPPYLKLRAQDLIREEELPDVRKSRSGNQLSLLDNITESEYTRLNEEGKDPNEHLSEISELRKALRRVVDEARHIVGWGFDELPTRDELPEYYEIIKCLITFSEIIKKCKNGEYESVDDLCGDIELMAKNAMRFNQPGSVWHTNGEQLLQLCDQFLNQSRSSDLPDEASTFA